MAGDGSRGGHRGCGSGSWAGDAGGFLGGITDAGDHCAHGDRGIHLYEDLQQGARGRCRDFRVHLVRADLIKGVVLGDHVTHLPVPLQYGGFSDALAHLGHDDIKGHGSLLCGKGWGLKVVAGE
jgi:hypothetical protein